MYTYIYIYIYIVFFFRLPPLPPASKSRLWAFFALILQAPRLSGVLHAAFYAIWGAGGVPAGARRVRTPEIVPEI